MRRTRFAPRLDTLESRIALSGDIPTDPVPIPDPVTTQPLILEPIPPPDPGNPILA